MLQTPSSRTTICSQAEAPCALELQVQAFWLVTLLGLHDPLPRSPKVRHLNSHTSLPQSHQTRLRADRLDIRAGEIVLLVNELVEIHIIVQRHLGSVQGKDLALGIFWISQLREAGCSVDGELTIRILEQNLSIDSPRSNQGRVEGLDLVSCHNNLDVSTIIESIKLVQQF